MFFFITKPISLNPRLVRLHVQKAGLLVQVIYTDRVRSLIFLDPDPKHYHKICGHRQWDTSQAFSQGVSEQASKSAVSSISIQ